MEKIKLYIIATPIGNLGDITYRAIETLKEVDFILCEDTRKTKVLLDKYAVKKPLAAYHQQSKPKQVEKIIGKIQKSQSVALVSEAGTPGISDPGNELIARIKENLSDEVEFVPMPGVSALAAIASVAGINMNKFVFLGFPPNKKGRNKFFQELTELNLPVVYYDSVYRVLKNLKLLQEISDKEGLPKNVIVGRELTKMHEQIKRGSIEEVIEYYENNPGKVRGEFVLIVY
ncbi:MAG: 16S rRNA (cytidine(1402)-2'-O)-methyltransferase [Candidatus Moranbacteria bacterium]|nr:16S rRNA (cytidine(1402)-2'-O)-methyltransferase [Candidatus Moranbacteria bacterium]